MSNKELSTLLKIAALATILCFSIFTFELTDSPKLIEMSSYAFMIGLAAMVLLFFRKLLSAIALGSLKGQPVTLLEGIFPIFYLMLSKEARQEWTEHIEQLKRKGPN